MVKRKHKPSGLAGWFSRLILLAGSFSILLFSCVYFGGGSLLNRYLYDSDYHTRYTEKHIEKFQQYVTRNNLSTQDVEKITAWVRKQPLVMLEVYRNKILLYTSSAPEAFVETQNEEESDYYDWVSYYNVAFSDGDAEVLLYANETYGWFTFLKVSALLLSFLLFLLIFLRGCRGLIRYICQLSTEIQAMEGGDLEVPITVQDDHELTQLAKSLDSMRIAFKEQRERESNIFHANQSMITQMSHDLRTPLTTLQIYTDILRLKKYEPGQLDEYLKKIDAKACQIKQLSENIFEYSLVSRHQDIELASPEPVQEVFHDLLSECVGYLGSQGFQFDLCLDWPELSVSVYPPYIKRLIDNISSNIVKYADPAVPVLIEVSAAGNCVKLSFQNAIRCGAAEQDGTHIGLSNIQAMMEKMGGEYQIMQTETSFCVALLFPGMPLL